MNFVKVDDALALRVDAARGATLRWLGTLQADSAPRGVHRISAAHDAGTWPGVLLYGTYNAIMCLDLLGGLEEYSPAERQALIDWLESHRDAAGIFHVPGMRREDTFKKADPAETQRYIDFHVTNYSLGAVAALAPDRRPCLDFVHHYLDPDALKAWLADRDFRDPWQEGNNIVNLASFLLLIERFGSAADAARVATALDILFAWHDRLQEPATGFWGVGQDDPQRRLHAFAGAMHNFHLWYAKSRPLPYHERAVDYALTLPTGIGSACIDVDAVDLLVHGAQVMDYRRGDIDRWLRAKLPSLLDYQDSDGGFSDERSGLRRQDGWVKGYTEPQGISNTFAAWFRWIAIAMAADHLWPGRWRWRFRGMIGIGYRRAANR
jgi:hypothetical protein